MVAWRQKMLKLHWLKCPKTVRKNEIWIRKSMIKNLIFGIYLLILDFLVKSVKANKSFQKKIVHFTIQFRSKSSLILGTSTYSTLKQIYSCNTGRSIFLIGVRMQLHPQSTWKANVCIFLSISVQKFLFKRRRKLLLGGRLINFHQADSCLGLIKCFKVFNFNWNFWKGSYSLAFWYFHQ